MREGLGIHGHLKVWDHEGNLIVDRHNMLVDAGLEAIVAKLIAAGDINMFKYVAFGTGTGATAAGTTALGTEVSGGTYARLTATQGNGATNKVYRLSGTWTNNSGASRVVTEYGILSAATGGTLLSRISTGDSNPPASKTVAVGETLTVQWDLSLGNAA